jgi:phosphate:Na+ symporter
MALTLVMCYEGWIPFELAAAMVMGENIGTTITANLAAIVANDTAKRTARAHFIFNMLGVFWMLLLLNTCLRGVDWFVLRNGGTSPFSSPEAIPVALSIFHTSFNIINTFVLIWFIPLIVTIVERMIPIREEEDLDISEPKFLTKNALNYPQTAMSALINESKRLFEGPVFEIMAHALNIHREDILAGGKAKQVVKASTEVINIDIDDVYYKKVKNIYGKTIEYSTRMLSLFNLPVKSVTKINQVRLANRYLVEAVKDARELQRSVDRYMLSENIAIKKKYDNLRKRMTKVLIAIYTIDKSKDPARRLDLLEDMRLRLREQDAFVDGTMDQLIREEKINLEMATTYANDSNYITDICTHLIKATELLYIESDTVMEELMEIEPNGTLAHA